MITYLGSAKSYIVIGNDSLTQNIFTVENGIQSRVNMNIRRFVFQNDAINVLTTVMPIVKTSRATSISGGTILEKVTFDTTETSDPNVVFRAPVMETARIVATPGNVIWQQYPNRMHTAVEQQMCGNQTLLPALVSKSGREFILRPGQSLLVQVVAATALTNQAIANNFWVECVWEEDSLSTYNISGTVSLSGSPVAGAKVAVLEADDKDMTNAYLREVITTPAGGTWSSTIRTDKIGFAYVQYKNGETYYTAPGYPYLT
jgi:hypothetical protein